MARIVEETLVITVSVLVKDGTETPELLDENFVAGIGEMAAQLISDPRAVVEVHLGDQP